MHLAGRSVAKVMLCLWVLAGAVAGLWLDYNGKLGNARSQWAEYEILGGKSSWLSRVLATRD